MLEIFDDRKGSFDNWWSVHYDSIQKKIIAADRIPTADHRMSLKRAVSSSRFRKNLIK